MQIVATAERIIAAEVVFNIGISGAPFRDDSLYLV
jgi:hypothetical protein